MFRTMLSFFSISGLALLDGPPLNNLGTCCEMCTSHHGSKIENVNHAFTNSSINSSQQSMEISEQAPTSPDPHLKLRNVIRNWLFRMHLKQSLGSLTFALLCLRASL